MDEASGVSFNNTGYQTDSIMKMRLDTTYLLSELEAFYRGSRVLGYSRDEQTGKVSPNFQPLGKPRMNDKGLQAMMSWLTSLFNASTVQGNKDNEEYQAFMMQLHQDLASDLMINLHEYGIDEKDYDAIIDKTIAPADMFFSRTIDNLEREGYGQTMRSVERVGEVQRGGFSNLNPFKNSGGMN